MRFVVFGAGALGGYIGVRLLQAGQEVAFVARGAHLDALRRTGLRLTGVEGEAALPPVEASDDPATLPPADAVLFCVKMYDVATAAALLPPLLRDGAAVLTVQNGIEAPDIVAATVGADAVQAGTAFFGGYIAGPGHVHLSGGMTGTQKLVFGARTADGAARGRALADALESAGVSTRYDTAIEALLWRKFCLISATSAAMAMTRRPIGPLMRDADTRWLIETAVAETAAVGRARGVPLPPGTEAEVVALIASMAPDSKASQLVDLEAGKPLELDWLSGAVVRLGAEAGVPTPFAETAYAALKPYAAGRS